MGNIGPGQLLLIALIILLIFGAGRIAEIGKGLGAGIKNFKKGLRDDEDADKKQLAEGKKEERDEKDS
jgi:sec-independent protein translocase protein TatA